MKRDYKLQTFHFSPRNRYNYIKSGDKKPTDLKALQSLRKGQKLNMHFSNYEQQYQRMQENGRIIKRITNPKRDFIIQRSIESVSIRSKPGTSSQQKSRSENRKRTNFTQFSQIRVNKTPTINAYQESHDFIYQNQSSSKGKDSFEQNPNYIALNSRINKNYETFSGNMNRTMNENSSGHSFNKENQMISKLKSYYGFGPTILCLKGINITLNPQLKFDDLLFMELMIKGTSKKLYTTKIITYQNFKKTEFKFALRVKKIGEFVPLKIWKVHGVDAVELGIVDLQLSRYLYEEQEMSKWYQQGLEAGRKELIDDSDDGKSILVNEVGKTKVLIKNKVNCKFRKNKIQESQGGVTLEYLIYRKKYT